MKADQEDPRQLNAEGVSVSLTHSPLDVLSTMASVRSPKAGATVVFAGTAPAPNWQQAPAEEVVLGTTRDNFEDKPVTQLEYSSYPPLALRTMLAIGHAMKLKHKLTAISIVHRLGVVPIGEESILVAVSAPHREAAWRGGEEALEECKEKVEVWKLEEFGGVEGGVWRANRNGAIGLPVKTQDPSEE